MKKIMIFSIIMFCLFQNYEIANAVTYTVKDGQLVMNDDCYTEDGKIKIFSSWYGRDDVVMSAEIWKINLEKLSQTFIGADEKQISGTISYPNYDNMKVGNFDLEWVFTPDEYDKYETKSGVFHFILFSADTEESKGKLVDSSLNDEMSLTASTLLLTSTNSSYDINLNNKPESDASYTWSSSNTKVAKVAKNGVVTSVGEGKATITCKVATSEEIQLLTANVIVSNDDNAIQLSETELTLEVGEIFDIDVDNSISKAKYKWTTSDKTIANVTSTSGKITALKTGSAIITCIVTTSDKKIYVLQCNVDVK